MSGRRHPLSNRLRAIQQLVGERGFELHLSPDASEPCAIWPGDPALVLLGGAPTDAQTAFLIGRAGCYVRAGATRVGALPPERALDLLALVASLFSPQLDPQHDPEALLADLPADVLTEVQAVIRAAASTTLPALYTGEAVLTGLARTADRLGMLSARELRATVETILRGEGGGGPAMPGGGDLTWAVRSNSRLRELVKYVLSESYHRVRHATGLAI